MNQHRPVVAAYDEDFYAWTQHQADLLRQLEQAGLELPVPVDLAHLAEEVADLGKSELRGTTSLIRNIMVHLIKAASDPRTEAVNHWRSEATAFQADLPAYFTPSMRQLIDLDKLWNRARAMAEANLRKHGRSLSSNVPVACPYTLADLMAEEFDFDGSLVRLLPEPPAE
jgi:hypothetical protein